MPQLFGLSDIRDKQTAYLVFIKQTTTCIYLSVMTVDNDLVLKYLTDIWRKVCFYPIQNTQTFSMERYKP